jgi:hypothetical protein
MLDADPIKTDDQAEGVQVPCANETEDVTATVTAGAQPAGAPPTVTEFMSAVVAWPAPNETGYINLHYSMPNPKPTPNKPLLKGMGWSFTSVHKLIQRAEWINTVPDKFKDVWFCTSRQSVQGTNSKGKPKAIRLAANALYQKSLWIDVDVDANDPKKYPSIEEALKALLLFAKTVGLPTPSAIVYSGGGMHVYWISKTPLTPQEWAPYASGLKSLLLMKAVKCDAGLTTDIARILRVPGTLNYKYDPPKPVTLAPTPLVMYDFAKLDFLKEFAGPVHTPSAQPAHNIFAEGVDPSIFKQKPAFTVEGGPGLDAGINREAPLLKAEPIFKQCGFMKHALLTEGADYDNPLWNISVLCSTFMENGNAIAHAISKGHASYSEVDTQALYDRKVLERKARGIGYPSCATINGSGCSACATCPHLSKGKSPLNLGRSPAPSPTQNPAAVVKFRDLDQLGRPKPTLANAVIAIRALGIEAKYDLFRNRTTVVYAGTSKTIREGSLTDHNASAVRSLINNMSIGTQSGPRIGIQEGPPFSTL